MSRSPVPDFFLKYKNLDLFNDLQSQEDVFKYFDLNKSNSLNIDEFENLLKNLFSCRGRPYHIPREKVQEIFTNFNANDEHLTMGDFTNFWETLVRPVLFPKNCFLIVDVQNDFIDGTLALKNCPAKQDGADVVPVINELIETTPFDTIAYTLDWHPQDHCSFFDNVSMRKISSTSPITSNFKPFDVVRFETYPDADQKLWPTHCVVGTRGAELHSKLTQVDPDKDAMKRKVVYVKKGNKPDIDSYSAFFDNAKLGETNLHADLKKNGITDIYVAGLASDVCVAATANDGLSLNYRVIFIEDASRGIDVDDMEVKKKMLTDQGAIVVSAKHVYNMVIGRDRRPELGYAILGMAP